MRLRTVSIHHVRIPLRRVVRHASHTRTSTDSLIVRSEWDDGIVGWGEGLPRHYVTGETIDDAWELLPSVELDESFGGRNLDLAETLHSCAALPMGMGSRFDRTCFGNSLRCALELSLLDGACRAAGLPLGRIVDRLPECEAIREPRDRVRYSGVITSMSLLRGAFQAWGFRAMGLRSCKIKVGSDPADVSFVRHLRRILGRSMSLRIDANESWSIADLRERLEAFVPLNVEAVEQPLPHARLSDLKGTRGTWPIPVMLDESLCSLADAQAAIADRTCDLFNIRLSKCGGFLPALAIANAAHEAGIGCQLGCQVGETGILSAAGRHFATAIGGLRWVEGSFDSFLVKERLTRGNLTFGPGGWASAIRRPGLGVDVDEAALRRVTVRTLRRSLE